MRQMLLVLVLLAQPLGGQRAEVSQFSVQGEDFLQQTHWIFVGEVVHRESFRSSDGRFILTRYLFRVLDRLKGDPGSLVELIEYGGTLGEETLRVSHNPEYRERQEYVVFSYRDFSRRNRTFGGPLGQLPVTATERGERMVRIPPSHPLAQVWKAGRLPALIELNRFANGLQDSMTEVSR